MAQTITIHCSYSEENNDVAQIIQESFRLLLQKELLVLAIEQKV